MKIPASLFLLIWFYAFSIQISQEPIDIEPIQVENKEIQSILDSANVKGSVLIYDLQKDIYHSNDFKWAEKGFIPASTFKLANTLIALESGTVEDAYSIFKWDGISRGMDRWNQDLTLKQAFHYSCVPCYQEVARSVGLDSMQAYTNRLGFGKMDVQEDNLDVFWLLGDSRISQYEEIDFLRRFYHSKLPISKRTENIAKELMISEEGETYKILSKTGWSSDGVWWYVGYLETNKGAYFFATNLEYIEGLNSRLRSQVTQAALEQLGFLSANRP